MKALGTFPARVTGAAVRAPSLFSQERTVDKEKAEKIRATIAEIVGFEPVEVQDADRFIIDYNISYGERKTLLERLNAEFGKDVDFKDFCALEDVGSVVQTFAA